MHELSIALSIIDLVLEEPAVAAGARVESVHLRIGALSGVAREALLFSYQVACRDGALAGSRLVIEELPVEIHCPACAGRRPAVSAAALFCAACGAPAAEVLQGRELVVAALEILE